MTRPKRNIPTKNYNEEKLADQQEQIEEEKPKAKRARKGANKNPAILENSENGAVPPANHQDAPPAEPPAAPAVAVVEPPAIPKEAIIDTATARLEPKVIPTSSAESLILARMMARRRALLRGKKRKPFSDSQKRRYNEARKQVRAAARQDAIARGLLRPKGRPRKVVQIPTGENVLDVYERAEAPKRTKTFAPKVIEIPPEFHILLGKEIRPGEFPETYPVFHIGTFRQIKASSAKRFMNDYRKALNAAGYEMPEDIVKSMDPIKYALWAYDTAKVDIWQVIRSNTPTAPAYLSISEFNARTSGLTSIPIQFLVKLLADKDESPLFKKVFEEHFIWHKFGSVGKRATGDRFKLQVESKQDKANKIPWVEWREMAFKYISKFFETRIDSPDLGKIKGNHSAPHLRNAVAVACYSLIPPTRVHPWSSTKITLIKPTPDRKNDNLYWLTDNWKTSGAYFGSFKNASAVAGKVNELLPFRHRFYDSVKEGDSNILKAILWNYASQLRKECEDIEGTYLFATGAICDNVGTDNLSGILKKTINEIDPKQRLFTTRLMRRSFISYWRSAYAEAPLARQEEVIVALHQTTIAVNIGYDRKAKDDEIQSKLLALAAGFIYAEDEDGDIIETNLDKLKKVKNRIEKGVDDDEASDDGEETEVADKPKRKQKAKKQGAAEIPTEAKNKKKKKNKRKNKK